MKRLFSLLIIYFTLAFSGFDCFAKAKYIKKVNVYCQIDTSCKSFKAKLENFLLNKVDIKNVKKALRIWLINEDIEKFYYEAYEVSNRVVINIHLKRKRKIGKISISPPEMGKFEKSIFKTIPFEQSNLE